MTNIILGKIQLGTMGYDELWYGVLAGRNGCYEVLTIVSKYCYTAETN